MKQGRPSDYTEWKARAICLRLANGESLRAICKRKYYPSRYAVMRWLRVNESFRNQYAQAREEQAEYYLEEIIDMTNAPTLEEDSNVKVQRDKLGIDTRKWAMERMAAKKYGSKQSIDHTSSDKSMSPTQMTDDELKEKLNDFGIDI